MSDETFKSYIAEIAATEASIAHIAGSLPLDQRIEVEGQPGESIGLRAIALSNPMLADLLSEQIKGKYDAAKKYIEDNIGSWLTVLATTFDLVRDQARRRSQDPETNVLAIVYNDGPIKALLDGLDPADQKVAMGMILEIVGLGQSRPKSQDIPSSAPHLRATNAGLGSDAGGVTDEQTDYDSGTFSNTEIEKVIDYMLANKGVSGVQIFGHTRPGEPFDSRVMEKSMRKIIAAIATHGYTLLRQGRTANLKYFLYRPGEVVPDHTTPVEKAVAFISAHQGVTTSQIYEHAHPDNSHTARDRETFMRSVNTEGRRQGYRFVTTGSTLNRLYYAERILPNIIDLTSENGPSDLLEYIVQGHEAGRLGKDIFAKVAGPNEPFNADIMRNIARAIRRAAKAIGQEIFVTGSTMTARYKLRPATILESEFGDESLLPHVILEFISSHQGCSSKEIFAHLYGESAPYMMNAFLRLMEKARTLAQSQGKDITTQGMTKATRYFVTRLDESAASQSGHDSGTPDETLGLETDLPDTYECALLMRVLCDAYEQLQKHGLTKFMDDPCDTRDALMNKLSIIAQPRLTVTNEVIETKVNNALAILKKMFQDLNDKGIEKLIDFLSEKGDPRADVIMYFYVHNHAMDVALGLGPTASTLRAVSDVAKHANFVVAIQRFVVGKGGKSLIEVLAELGVDVEKMTTSGANSTHVDEVDEDGGLDDYYDDGSDDVDGSMPPHQPARTTELLDERKGTRKNADRERKLREKLTAIGDIVNQLFDKLVSELHGDQSVRLDDMCTHFEITRYFNVQGRILSDVNRQLWGTTHDRNYSITLRQALISVLAMKNRYFFEQITKSKSGDLVIQVTGILERVYLERFPQN